MLRQESTITRQCCICLGWTTRGDSLPSGNPTPAGWTPCDNFICVHCQREAREARLVDAALELHEKAAA